MLLLVRLDRERDVVHGAGADDAVLHLRVLEERDQRAGGALCVAEPEVPRAGVVVVDAALDEREAEHVAVEGGRAVEVAADRCDVMQAGEAHPAGLIGRRHRFRQDRRRGGRSRRYRTRMPTPPERRLNSVRKTARATTSTTAAATIIVLRSASAKNSAAIVANAQVPDSTSVWER